MLTRSAWKRPGRFIAAEHRAKKRESDAAWERRVRTQYIDVCRYLLPAASLANVGMPPMRESWKHAIQKLLSSSLAEVQTIGGSYTATVQYTVIQN